MTNPGDDIYGSAEHQAFRETVRKFVQAELVPRAREFDELGRFDKSLYRKMGDLGLLGIRYDQQYGGLGLDYSYHAIFLEELSLCDNAGVAMGISVQTDMATPALHRFGSEQLKQRYLVPAIRGEQVAAIAVTEPGAGSDVAGIKTRAVRDGDHWVLNGSKMYITNAATADWLCLLAVTDPAAGYGGFTQIVVPTDARGFSYQLLDKIGNLGSDTGLLFFDDVRVPVSNTIGDPNRGFQQQMNQFQDERMVPVVMGPVTARQLWEVTLRHCQQRIAFGKPLAKMQVNQHKFVDMMIQITAAQEFAHRCIRKMVRGEDATLEQVRLLEEQLALARAGGGEKYVRRHRERKKLLPRERIELLLDRDAPFLELSPLAAWGTEFTIGASVVTGVGVVSGVECVLIANDPTVKGGATNPITLDKNFRAMEIAAQNRLPLINLTESAGADLPNQARIFVRGGRTFRELTRRSAERIPAICLVFGSSTAGGAYVPGMSDYAVFVKNAARVFLAGPPLVKMAINEDTDDESLGGAEMHSRVSGVSDYLAEDELDAIRLGREIMAHLNWRKLGQARMAEPEPPRYDPDELLGIGSIDVRKPFEVREVIARIVDGSRFDEFKPAYGTTLVTGWAHLHGYPIGILGNNGILFSDSSEKAAQFIQLSNKIDVPLLFLQNITGFMVGTQYEQGGIIKDGAKMINAVSNSTVPMFTVMIGSSYGAGNYGMCGRAYEPRFLFTWPNHRIAVMGPEQLAGVLSIVRRGAAERAGEPYDEAEDQAVRRTVEQQIEQESNAFYATARIWDDGIIDPCDTRTALGIALSAAFNQVVRGADTFGVFRM